MKRKRRQLLEVEAMLTDYERRLTNSDQFRSPAIPGPKTMKAKDAARLNQLLDEIFGKAGDK